MSIESDFLVSAGARFREYKLLAEKAIAQLNDDQLHMELAPESNSIAVIMRHLAGNMRSRWVDFLTSDGEKPSRHRDTEFEEPNWTREQITRDWDDGWQSCFSAVDPLTTNDLGRTILIRGKPLTVVDAIHRQLTHYAYHVGQIVFIAKVLRGNQWSSLSIPRGQSQSYNQMLGHKT